MKYNTSMQPSSKKPIAFGFLGIMLIFIGIFHFIFTGDFTLQTITNLEHSVDLISPILGFISIIYANKLNAESLEEKANEIYNHPKVIGVMTGASYFYITIITLFVIIPVIALVWFWLKGEI